MACTPAVLGSSSNVNVPPERLPTPLRVQVSGGQGLANPCAGNRTPPMIESPPGGNGPKYISHEVAPGAVQVKAGGAFPETAVAPSAGVGVAGVLGGDRKSTRLNSSH